MSAGDELNRNVGGFLIIPDFSIALLTTDFVKPYPLDIGLPSASFLAAARKSREAFLKVAPWTLRTSESQALSQHWVSLITENMSEKESSLFSTWFTDVAPTVNVWQPLTESWLGIVERYEAGVLDTDDVPMPIEHVSALISRVTDRPDWEELTVKSEWDCLIARVYGTEEDDADMVQHFDRFVATVGHRYIWSWVTERFGDEIDWKVLASWGRNYLPAHIAEQSHTIDLKGVLPLPSSIYNALKVAIEQ